MMPLAKVEIKYSVQKDLEVRYLIQVEC